MRPVKLLLPQITYIAVGSSSPIATGSSRSDHDRTGRHRLAEVEALQFVATIFGCPGRNLLRFDTFRHNRHFHELAHGNDHANNGVVARQITDETAIQFDAIDRTSLRRARFE